MTLPFMTTFPEGLERIGGQPTHFVPKIWKGLLSGVKIPLTEFCEKLGTMSDEDKELFKTVNPKLHTFREDSGDRIKPGMKLHMVTGNRTKNRFQFVPTIPCTSKQQVWISPRTKSMRIWRLDFPEADPNSVKDGWWQNVPAETIWVMAMNDGFNSVEYFFAYFSREWGGYIIHWTDLQY